MTRLVALLLACHAVLQVSAALLLPPRNLSLYSKNFEHILQWEDPNNQSVVYYRVMCSRMFTDYETVKDCANLTTRLCNLTKDFTNISNAYRVRVFSFTDHGSSIPSTSVSLIPKQQTVLGPPIVDVSPCDRCIKVSIQPPACRLWSAEKRRYLTMLDAYPALDYNIKLIHKEQVISSYDVTIHKENYTFNESNLLPNANYCVSVTMAAVGNKHSAPSQLKCVLLEDRANESRIGLIVGIVFAVLFFILLVLGLILLDCAGYICRVKNLIPKTLKSIPTSETSYMAGSEFTSSTFFSPVDVIISKKLELEEKPESEEKSDEGGYERRKILQQSNTSSTATSGDFPSGVSSSVGSSGQATSSAEEDHSVSEHGSSTIATPPARATEASANLPINTSGVFNVNLNTVSIASPANVWPVEALPEKSEDSMESNKAGILLDQPNHIGLDVGDLDVEFCSDFEEEEDISENEDSDNQLISGYMRR